MGLEELSYQQLLNQLQQKEADIQQLESQLAAQQDDILSHRQRSELLDFALDAVISSTGKQAESFKCPNTGIFGCYHISWLANKKPAI